MRSACRPVFPAHRGRAYRRAFTSACARAACRAGCPPAASAIVSGAPSLFARSPATHAATRASSEPSTAQSRPPPRGHGCRRRAGATTTGQGADLSRAWCRSSDQAPPRRCEELGATISSASDSTAAVTTRSELTRPSSRARGWAKISSESRCRDRKRATLAAERALRDPATHKRIAATPPGPQLPSPRPRGQVFNRSSILVRR